MNRFLPNWQRSFSLGSIGLLAGLCWLFDAGAMAAGSDTNLELANDGTAHYSVSLQPGAGEVERFAGAELVHYLGKISGARFAVQQGEGRPKSIVLRGGDGTGDGYSIEVIKDQIALTGDSGRAVLFAVYDFLEQLGCRWLAPRFSFYSGQSEYIPKSRELVFSSVNAHRRSPRFSIRKLDISEGLSHDAASLQQLIEWMPKAGFNTLMLPLDFSAGRVQWDKWRAEATPELQRRGITIEVGGHGYENFIHANMPASATDGTELFKLHPEWFGLNETGQRDRSRKQVFCTSNPAAADHVTSRVVEYLKARPEIDVFDFWPPDSAVWCECEPCRALGEPGDRQALLLQRLYEALRAAGRSQVRLEIIAYSRALLPPTRTPLPRDVLVDFCPINQSFEFQIDDPASERNAQYVAALKQWRDAFPGDVALYSYYRKYAWKSLPVILPRYLQKDLKFYAAVPVQGVHVYAEPGDWGTFELNYYVLGRLAWDPGAPVERLVKEFCAARYGKHAVLAEATLEQMEDLVRTTCSLPFTALKSPDEISLARTKLQQSGLAIRRAASLPGRGESPALRRLGLCLEYAVRDLEIQHARALKAAPLEVRSKVDALVDYLLRNRDAGVFVLTGRNDLDRFYKRYDVAPGS